MNPDAMDLSGDMAFKAHGELGCNLCPHNPAEADRVMAKAGRAAICRRCSPGLLWLEQHPTGAFCRHPLPRGLLQPAKW